MINDPSTGLMSRIFLRSGQDNSLGQALLAANVAAVAGDVTPLRQLMEAERMMVLGELESMAALSIPTDVDYTDETADQEA